MQSIFATTTLLCTLVSQCINSAEAKPILSTQQTTDVNSRFHELSITIENPEQNTYSIQGQIFTVLPRVVLYGPDVWTDSVNTGFINRQNLEKIGAKNSHMWLLHTTSPAEAVVLAQEISANSSKYSVWVDVLLPKVPYTSVDFNDEHYGGQWYVEYLNMPILWQHGLGDSNTSIAVIDSGIDISHPDLVDKYHDPYDAFSGDDDPSPDVGEFCGSAGNFICDEHGTAVSGIALAMPNNNTGIVGLCPNCSLIPIKMLGEGNGSLSADILAFEHAIEANASVINNSWGFVEPTIVPTPLRDVITRALTEPRDGKGSVVVFAAGNDGRELTDGELCSIDGVLCISAMDSYGRPTAYTNTGMDITIAAPSATVSIAPGEELTTNFGGTSAAAPVVSGIAGWILSEFPEMTSAEIYDVFVRTAEQSPLITPDENGHHPSYGYGIISPENMEKELYPVEETPQKTGCQSVEQSSWLIVLFALLFSPYNTVSRRFFSTHTNQT